MKKLLTIFLLFFLVISVKAETNSFNDINYNEYKNLISSEEIEFVYFGSPTCGYCEMIEPVLKDVQKELNFQFNYLNVNEMKEEDFGDLPKTYGLFQNPWGTPTLLAIKDGQIFNYSSGYKEKAEVLEFINESNEKEVDEFNFDFTYEDQTQEVANDTNRIVYENDNTIIIVMLSVIILLLGYLIFQMKK